MSSSTPEAWIKAAVIFAIFASPPHGVIFIERSPHLRKHAGQIGLPGGRVDPADGDEPRTTALRELHEELGVDAQRVRVVGRLPEVQQDSNRFLVTPVVGVIKPETPLTIDGSEIVGVFTVPLEAILASDGIYEDVEMTKVRGYTTYALDFDGHHIWGLTARILKHFSSAWNDENSVLRSGIEAAFALQTSK
ncbi:MAG: NUDIX hydrolase [Vulcanimicrobiaceae bacterium]